MNSIRLGNKTVFYFQVFWFLRNWTLHIFINQTHTLPTKSKQKSSRKWISIECLEIGW